MKQALWHWHELIAASGGSADGNSPAAIGGVSIDTRTIEPGDLFVALKDTRDGHDFVGAAFAAGAAAALVSHTYKRAAHDGALIRTPDPLAALQAIGIAARGRLSPDARIIAVTGSAGKTGTKEMLRACLSLQGATHASEKSYNNHWGVPLTLARMPRETRFGVFEIGMNHAGEITPLTRMVRPHAAIVTNVFPVHLGNFPSEAAIAEAKAEIFTGLEPGGVAIINRDNPHDTLLRSRAEAAGARIVMFGQHPDADVRILISQLGLETKLIGIKLFGEDFEYELGTPGEHYARNSLAVLAAIKLAGADPEICKAALGVIEAPAGRGRRLNLTIGGRRILLIDESYNANPASMAAALRTMAGLTRDDYPRRIAVLGDMLELGPATPALHKELGEPIAAAGTDRVFACGPSMRLLYDDLPGTVKGCWAPTSTDLLAPLLAELRAGDAVMIKGSLGSNMAPLVKALLSQASQSA